MFNFIKRSLVIKYTLLLLLVIFFVLGTGFLVVYRSVYGLLTQAINQEAWSICRENANLFDQPFFRYEGITSTLASSLSIIPVSQWSQRMEDIGSGVDCAINGIVSLGVAAAPVSQSNGERKGCFILFQSNKGKPEVLEKVADYESEEWYCNAANKGKGVWNEPFLSPITGNLLVIHSCPFFRESADGKKELLGIVQMTISLDWLDGQIQKIPLNEHGFVTLLSPKRQIIAGKIKREMDSEPERIVPSGEIFLCDEDTEKQVRNARLGIKPIRFIVPNRQKGNNVSVFLHKMKSTSWIFCISYPENEIYSPISYFKSGITIVIAVTFAAVLLVAMMISYRMTRPLKKMTAFAKEIGKGNFSAQLPVIKGRDEVATLGITIDKMRQSLVKSMEELKRATIIQERIDSELQIARAIQSGLLPDVRPPFPSSAHFEVSAKMQPAKEVGGDFYDCAMFEPGKLVFVIGDVSGKGVPASLYMAVTQMLQRMLWRIEKFSPGDITSKLNAVICAHNNGRLFVSLLCGVIDAESGRMLYCNAGHDPFYILKETGKVESPCMRNGIPIGMRTEAKYTESECTLEDNDTLVLYTDGIPEAEDENHAFYGMERFKAVLQECAVKKLSVERINDEIFSAARTFSGKAEQSDDITYMVIKYRQ